MKLADKCQEQEQEVQGPYPLGNFRRYYSSPELDNSSRQDVPVPATLTSAVSRKSEDALGRVLSKLRYLDLTGRVVSECAVMKAHGGYCDIFVGSLSPVLFGQKIKVAIKRLRVCLHNERTLAKVFVKEIYIWSKLHKSPKRLVIQRVNPRTDIVAILLGIAKGLGYLHNKNVVHSDLKADNVLISQLGCPLICDFGISSMTISSQSFPLSTTHGGSLRGSTRWMSIELSGINSDIDPKHTKASDVWAYGMTIYEILTKQRPYAHLKADQRVILAIIRGELPSWPDYNKQLPALEVIWGICEDCWKTDPEDRITISEIILRMEQCYSSAHRLLQRTLSRTRRTIPPPPPYKLPRNPYFAFNPDPVVNPVVATGPPASRLIHNTINDTTASCMRLVPEAESEPKPFPNPIPRNLTRYIRLDLSSPTYAPITPSSSGDNEKKPAAIHEDYLSQDAPYPAVSKAVITCDAFGKSEDSRQAIAVEPVRRTVSIGDVFRAVHRALQTPMAHVKWVCLSEHEKYEANKSYTRRCGESEFEPEKKQDMRRVDFLGNKSWFGGILKVDD
ncbi:hypothetical protein M0805_005217, partial [Coniferiporia weirii]